MGEPRQGKGNHIAHRARPVEAVTCRRWTASLTHIVTSTSLDGAIRGPITTPKYSVRSTVRSGYLTLRGAWGYAPVVLEDDRLAVDERHVAGEATNRLVVRPYVRNSRERRNRRPPTATHRDCRDRRSSTRCPG